MRFSMYSFKTLSPRQSFNKNVFLYNAVRYIKFFKVDWNKQKVMLTTKNFHVKESNTVRVKRTPKWFWVQTQVTWSNCEKKKALVGTEQLFLTGVGLFSFSWLQLAITRQSIRDLVERAASRCASKPTPELHLERASAIQSRSHPTSGSTLGLKHAVKSGLKTSFTPE